jgi:N-acetylneuraminic acid mutarotase
MIAQGQLSTNIAINTSSTPGVLYLGKRFAVTFTFATEPTLNHTATVLFSAAPSSTGTRVLKNRWAAFPANATTPSARAGHSAIWTGKKLIIWGGNSGTEPTTYVYYGGAAYDPGTNIWTPISSAGAPSARSSHVAVWTGTKMIVWGGYNNSERWKNDGGVYDPATDTWSVLPQSGAIPSARALAVGVWDGAKMIVWGGYGQPTQAGGPFWNDGAAYDPSNGAWVAIAATNAPSPRTGATGVWTGTKMIVWDGTYAARPVVDGIYNYYNDGAAYDPLANTWTPISFVGAPSARAVSRAAWTGTQMITWAGVDASVQLGDGGIYDPGANVWSSMSMLYAPANRAYGASVWTGSSFIYWGGANAAYLNDGGIYY